MGYFYRSEGNFIWCGYETLAWQFTSLLRTLYSTSLKWRLITAVLTHQHHVHITEAEGGMQIKQALSYRGKTAMSEQSRFIRTTSWSTSLLLTYILIHDRSNMQNMKHHNSKKWEIILANNLKYFYVFYQALAWWWTFSVETCCYKINKIKLYCRVLIFN